MQLPRWLVIAMLTTSVLSVLGAAGWWWVTWPERTAREFVEAVSANRDEDASRLMRCDPSQPLSDDKQIFAWPFARFERWKTAKLESHPRSTRQLLASSQDFTVNLGLHRHPLEFTVHRGNVTSIYPPFHTLSTSGAVLVIGPDAVRFFESTSSEADFQHWVSQIHGPPNILESLAAFLQFSSEVGSYRDDE